ncbi:MAG: tyrosine--tRNA ligase [Bacteroidetes bacterium]|jgi:tyrosyl-tRNA synthetase|nr:tyrosine--tRNA ligase [Schleiferiaceae bacterium]PTM17213.1 MAG: tyrosine--tRNA ligase [Bacteroidota bacterium]HAR21501.1 tyrosine--tRNA ligase [Cryomorphaceae bacterium]MDA8642320.1 tyrosine--tRNA ligase [Schleiferiaceae bacterium]MDB2436482.1 tyrosine--tRNA ligase [Schleiferiaceae bacterium]
MNTNFVEELKWRGMLHDIMPDTEELLTQEMVSGYIGFDPTADSLGVGNMVQIMTLVHFQRAGHKPIALVGGATGMVGDPSGKSAERNLLDLATLNHNLESQKAQLAKFLNFDCGENSAEIVNNYDWFKEFDFLGFIRDVGKHMSVNYMMAKDSVKNRLETGMSFTEFSYQLIQGYDFYHLWKNNGVKLQMGGSDQWGNITTGTELIRRLGRGSAHALTTPLIKKADGTKFGKSEGGNVWLDPKRTTPYAFYQFWLNAADSDAENYIKIFSIESRETIEALIAEHAEAPHQRKLQKALAEEITVRVHSQEDLENAQAASEILFGKATEDQLRRLDNDTLMSVFEGVPQHELSAAALEGGLDIVDALAEVTTIFPSKGEARKMVQGNGVAINKTKVTVDKQLTSEDVVAGNLILVQKGKKNYYLVRVI